MIYRVVIIDNGNQVSLTQQGEATAYFETDKKELPEDVILAMTEALNKLTEVKEL